ncbi:substrate-binding periplasmic protein [Pseudomonas sp. 5P_3.1_Bac2]|uniref:substrate-binding periplasmic protein n=1 Tax=Pseudomonas sp. 5P_3.1_Bac2 TaxID=2971617 RepID=UPI0021CA1C92|nr:transporter substrate-binding domain-containing protein [Pseudomonas sp. 5P_3.1_Bac2]MCU1718268.1 transporter substrate-binding domain-containing protein [Pseudomonas sp. 5P_3.1_Bac2]
MVASKSSAQHLGRTRGAWLLMCVCLLVARSALAAELQMLTEDYRPLSYMDNGKPTGMAVNVVEQLMKRTGDAAKIEIMPWTRGYYRAQHEANTALFATVRTPRREALFQWVGPITLGETGIYTRRGSGLQLRSLADVERLGTIAVPKQWYSYEYLSEMGVRGLYGVPTPQHMVRMFKYGRIAVLVANNMVLEEMLAQQGMRSADVELQFTFIDNNSYIAFSKGTDTAVVQRWQMALQGLIEDGTLARIHHQWLVEPEAVPLPVGQLAR